MQQCYNFYLLKISTYKTISSPMYLFLSVIKKREIIIILRLQRNIIISHFDIVLIIANITIIFVLWTYDTEFIF